MDRGSGRLKLSSHWSETKVRHAFNPTPASASDKERDVVGAVWLPAGGRPLGQGCRPRPLVSLVDSVGIGIGWVWARLSPPTTHDLRPTAPQRRVCVLSRDYESDSIRLEAILVINTTGCRGSIPVVCIYHCGAPR